MNNSLFNRTHVPLVIDGITTRKIFQACRKKIAYSSFARLLSTSFEKYLSKHFFFLLLLPYLDVVEHDHETHQDIVDL